MFIRYETDEKINFKKFIKLSKDPFKNKEELCKTLFLIQKFSSVNKFLEYIEKKPLEHLQVYNVLIEYSLYKTAVNPINDAVLFNKTVLNNFKQTIMKLNNYYKPQLIATFNEETQKEIDALFNYFYYLHEEKKQTITHKEATKLIEKHIRFLKEDLLHYVKK